MHIFKKVCFISWFFSSDSSIHLPIHQPCHPPCSSSLSLSSIGSRLLVYEGQLSTVQLECDMSASTDRLLKVSPPVDAETQQVVEKVARFVVEGGPEIEATTIECNRENPAFRSAAADVTHLVLVCLSPLTINLCSSISFLYDNQSPAYHLYHRKVQEYRAAASKNSSLPAAGTANLRQPAASQVHATVNASSSPQSTEADNPPVKRKRKSRWGSEDERVELPIPQVVAPPENNVFDPDAASLTGELIKIC